MGANALTQKAPNADTVVHLSFIDTVAPGSTFEWGIVFLAISVNNTCELISPDVAVVNLTSLATVAVPTPTDHSVTFNSAPTTPAGFTQFLSNPFTTSSGVVLINAWMIVRTLGTFPAPMTAFLVRGAFNPIPGAGVPFLPTITLRPSGQLE